LSLQSGGGRTATNDRWPAPATLDKTSFIVRRAETGA
jgi:hypothetical protein